jgi:hypothetical protein
LNKKLLGGGALAGIVTMGVGGFVLATVIYKANEKGSNQGAGGQATTLTIRVEAGLADPSAILIPDFSTGGCPVVPSTFVPHPAPASTVCPGGAIGFSVENTSDIPLRVTDVEQRACVNNAVYPPTSSPCPFTSDKNTDGSWAYLPIATGSCAQFASFNAPVLNPADYGVGHPWPVIPAHSTLQVNGSDGNALGAGLLHLSPDTPSACQGATYQVPLDVTAQDVRAAAYPF